MKGLNLSKFKKIQDDEGAAVFENDNGHKITVAKSALSEKMRAQLHEIPIHAYNGIDADQIVNDSMNPANLPMPTKEDELKQIIQQKMMVGGGATLPGWESMAYTPQQAEMDAYKTMAAKTVGAQEQQAQASQELANKNKWREAAGLQPQAGPAGSQQPNLAPSNIPPEQPAQQMPQANYPGDVQFKEGIGNIKEGIKLQQEADVEKAKREELAQNEYNDQLAYVNRQYQDTHANVMAQRNQFMKEINEGKLDPDRYMNEMGVGRRISTAIGLILGGMGGGITGQENPVLKYLNNQIDNDIKLQMKNIDRKQNLLSATADHLRDAQSGAMMLRTHANDILALKLKQAAEQTADPAAKARALAALGELQIKTSDMTNQMANRGQMGALMQLAQTGKVNPQLLPKEMRETYVPGFGLATTKEGAAKANEKVAQFRNAQDGIAQLLSLAKKGSSLSPTDYTKAQALANLLQGALREPIVGPGAVSESEREMIKQVIGNPLALTKWSGNEATKLETLHQRLGGNLKNELVQFGIGKRSDIPQAPPMLRK